ncbi:DMT family transporter [Kyrpidia spormannii]|uniref:Uncharacterized protein n=1 Tax=Kyrpidia spormannii TaxID=2055160 RepID=A0ACA8ZDA9_9BACL|nr:membrane protein of unknown function [Kyrpidia spormannii]
MSWAALRGCPGRPRVWGQAAGGGAASPLGSGGLVGAVLSLVTNVYLLAGIVSFVLALGAYTFALTRFQLSVAYPMMTSLGLVLVALASMVVFREPFTWSKTVGTLLILAGVIFVARGDGGGGEVSSSSASRLWDCATTVLPGKIKDSEVKHGHCAKFKRHCGAPFGGGCSSRSSGSDRHSQCLCHPGPCGGFASG